MSVTLHTGAIFVLKEKPLTNYNYSMLGRKLFGQSCAKNMGNAAQVKKKLLPQRNINRIYNEKMHYSFQQLPTLRLRILIS